MTLRLQGTLFSCQFLSWSLVGREAQAVAGFSGEVVVGVRFVSWSSALDQWSFFSFLISLMSD